MAITTRIKSVGTGLLATLCLMAFAQNAHAIPELSIGPFGPGITDGTEPFNIDGNCATDTSTAAPGDDCGEKNNQVRTQDDVIFNWSITANNFTPGQDPLANVVLEQTLKPNTNAVVSFQRIPARCTPDGGGGTTPPSSITTETNGDIKLVCNLGEFQDGEQTSFGVYAKVSGESWNGSSFSSEQRVYSLADDGVTPNATEGLYTSDTYTISARPIADLSLSAVRYLTYLTERDVGQGLEKVYYSYVNVRIATPQKAGTEAMQQPLNFKLQLSATKDAVDGDDYTNTGFEYYMDECRYNPSLWTGEVYGKETYGTPPTYPLHRKVIDSGDCSYTRPNAADDASAYTFTINNADLSGNRFPTQGGGSVDLSAGPYYYVNMRLRYVIPVRVIDNADGAIDGSGSIYVSGVLNDFDPIGVSGIPNYAGLEKEPGYNGNPMPDGTKSNNLTGPYNYYITTRGTWAHYAFTKNNDAGTGYSYFVPSSSHSGGGLLPPNKAYASVQHLGNNGSNDLSNPMGCNVFDNTTQKLVDRSNIGATTGTYAYVGTYAAGGFDHTNYIVEYGNVDLTGDNPIDKDGDGTSDYNNQTGRYEGNWDVQGLVRCDDATTTWQTDPTQVGSGIDDVNIVRVRLKDSVKDTVKLSSTQYIRFTTPLEARNTFYGGPNAGEIIPMGAVLASFGSVKVDEYWSGAWTPANSRPYKPAPESGNSDGDRVTIARTTSYLDSESLTPVATPGKTNTTIAGRQVVWKTNASISSLTSEPALEENVQIIAELPPEVSYDQSCTANFDDGNGNTGTPASLVEYDTDRNGATKTDYTRLIWNLGTVTANTAILPRVICTNSDPLAPNNTSVVAYFEIRGDNLISLISQRSDTHTITLEQVGSIQVSKKVDRTLDDKDDDQQYTLRWANFAPSFPIDAPTIIDVLPYIGDDTAAGSERTPPSAYDGSLALTAAPTVTWLDGTVPTAAPTLGTWFYTNDTPNTIDSDPDLNTSNWCLEADFNSGNPGCPANFAGVTAIKFVANYELEKDGDPKQGMEAKFALQATGNTPGNVYTNRFAFDSSSLPPEQFLRSNTVSVHIASYSIGDLVFADIDKNGQFDTGTDKALPDGVTINLHQASDGTVVQTVLSGQELPGRYVFDKLGSGDYYVEIPASEFQPGSILEDWDTLYTAAGADDNKNEVEDQDGYKTGDPATNGIRSNVITLSATPPLPGQIPKGDEPLGDNTANITDLTGDDFSNYTLDIALQPIYDLGDAPATYGIAPHMQANLIDFPYLGIVKPDRETTTPHGATADGDGNDEEAIDTKTFPAWEIGQKCAGRLPDGTLGEVTITETSYCMTVNVVNPTATAAQVVAWIDFNEDDVFNEAEERSVVILNTDTSDDATQGNVPANTVNQTIVLQWNGVTRPANDSYARIRITTDAAFKDSTYLAATASADDGEVEDYVFSLAAISTTVSGRVYNDANADGVNDTAEAGISRLPVVLMNTVDNSCVSVKTDDDGYYIFEEVPQGNYQLYEASKETVPTPQSCDVNTARDPAGYLSTTTNTLNTFTVADTPITDKDFGDVLLPTLKADGTQAILPGNVTYYTHTFTSPSNGSVTFSLDETAPTEWSSVLYRDTDCDGELDTAEASAPLTTTQNTTANEQVCLLHKVFAAATASNGQQSVVILSADFVYGTGSTQASDQTLNNTDITTVSIIDPTRTGSADGKLELVKTVQNITQGTAETETQNEAKPGDVLQYRISYRNTGTAAITDLKVNDSAPPFTVYANGTAACPSTPTGLNCSSNASNAPEVVWNFTGSLAPGAQGSVVYRVAVE